MKKKVVSILLCLVMAMSMFVGCGSKNEAQTTNNDTSTSAQVDEKKAEDTSSTGSTKVDETSQGTKKIVIVQEAKDELRDASQKNIKATLEKNGYASGKNAEITEIQMNGDEKKSQEVVDQIKTLKPDVVILNVVAFSSKSVAAPLLNSGIPVLLTLNVEDPGAGLVDENGKPKGSVSGIYTMPKDMRAKAFDLLNKIYPAKGKKAVFLTTPGFFQKDDIVKSLQTVGVELKDYVESKYTEDFEAAVKKYNADDEVAWMLTGVWPGLKKDGSAMSILDFGAWDIANRKKPSVTYWAAAVEIGILCGLGVDIAEQGNQVAEMAVKVLKGESIGNLTAENPRKIDIVLNQKRAKDLKIEFPADILGSAAKVYDKTAADK
ncbi:MAG: hypothetical protein N3B21_09040 [Clostridia bacterium]|nr:hypothetical protein [Clostridia bacterium]